MTDDFDASNDELVMATERLLIADHDANAVIWAKFKGEEASGETGGADIGGRAARHEEVVHAALELNARASSAVHRQSMTLMSRFSQVLSLS